MTVASILDPGKFRDDPKLVRSALEYLDAIF
jgi:hypothetical protein